MSEEYPLEIERLMRQTQSRIMSDIVRRIKINSQITRTADWQLDRLHELGEGKKEVRRIIRKYLGLTDKQVEELYKQAAESGHAYNKSLYEAVGENFIPYVENKGLQQLVSAMVAQTKGEMKNITQSMGFAVKQGNKLVFKEIAKYYQETLDGAITDIASGAFDYNSVIKRVINEMTNSGLRTVDYASGWTNRIDVAARRAVMTGVNQLTGQIQQQNAETLNTNKYETSWHSTARPEHQLWQGRVYSYDELVSICGLGDVAGLKGANCRHDYFPFIEGVSVRVYTDEQLEEMNAKENEKRTYNGKEYTAYEATQRQRYLETAMRAQRQKVKLLQEANADEKDITAVKCKYQKLSKEYTDFSKKMGLPQERQRIYSDGLGKINMNAPTKANSQAITKTEPIAKSENGGIIEMSRNRGKTHRKLSDSGNQVITAAEYQRITAEPLKHGVKIIRGDPYHEERLRKMHKSASTIGDTVFLSSDCTVSDVLEEMYHFEQNRKGLNSDKNATLRVLLNEIDAQEYLLSVSEKYKIPQEEIEVTKQNLLDYQEKLEEYYRRESV
jgi:hypothetical protein